MILSVAFAIISAASFSATDFNSSQGQGAISPFRGFLPPSANLATQGKFEIKHVQIKEIFVPMGFDTSDLPQFFAEIEIKNATQTIIPPQDSDIKIQELGAPGKRRGLIQFDLKAMQYPEPGGPALARRLVRIQLSRTLDAGSYEIKYHPDTDRLESIGALKIANASPKNFRKRDERVYPSVHSARIVKVASKVDGSSSLALRLEGKFREIPEAHFGEKCYDFDDSLPLEDPSLPLDKRMILDGNVYAVLAPLKVVSNAALCEKRSSFYSKDIPIPGGWENDKRYLFYIPTDDGDAFTLVETLNLDVK